MNLNEPITDAIEAAGLAGAVATVGDREGVRYIGAFGARDLESGDPMAADTLFQIASMTKAVTSVAAMQLVEKGGLSLDAPLGAVLPELADLQVIDGFDAEGTAILRPATSPVTLRHLLTHTSGFGYEFMNADMVRARGPQGTPPMGSRAGLVSALLFDPGERWEYGISTDWVGMAVEAASGSTLGDYLTAHVLAPLAMTDTGFKPSAEQMARRATMYLRQDDGSLAPFPVEIGGGDVAEFDSGGGGLMSTAGDYMRFLRMILNGGTLDGARLLSRETVAEMSRNQIGGLRAGHMESIVPQFSHPFDQFPDMHPGWGLGFLINPEPGPNGRAAGSLAWAGIANTYYWIDPANGITGLLLSQFLPFGDPAMLEVLGAFEREVYAAL
jgi:methyl acetate hydrolase